MKPISPHVWPVASLHFLVPSRLFRRIKSTSLTILGLLGWASLGVTATEKEKRSSPIIELCADLNGDGQIDQADARLNAAAYRPGASAESINKGTEYCFVDDDISNGLWDKSDHRHPDKSTIDDDAIRLKVTLPKKGAMWIEDPTKGHLHFFEKRDCRTPIIFPRDLATQPLTSNEIYLLADKSLPQEFTGDLVMKVGTPDQKQVLAQARQKLTIVCRLGDSKQHYAMVKYIKENNTPFYYNEVYLEQRKVRYVAFLKKQVSLVAINARRTLSRGINQVAQQYPRLACITNFSFAEVVPGGSLPVDRQGFFVHHFGKMYHEGHWDQDCSVALDPHMMPPRNYLAMDAAHHIHFGPDDPPEGTLEGSGGLHEYLFNQDFTSYVDINVGADELLVVASSEWLPATSANLKVRFSEALMKGAGPDSHYYSADANAAVAMAVADPDKVLQIVQPGPHHDLKNNYPRLKVYMGIDATPLRPVAEH